MDTSFLFGFKQADTSFILAALLNEQGKQSNFFIMSKDFLGPITAEYQ